MIRPGENDGLVIWMPAALQRPFPSGLVLFRHDIVVELGDETFRLKKSLETASKLGARFALIVGENEVKAGAFALKNLETGEQVSVVRADLAQKIQADR